MQKTSWRRGTVVEGAEKGLKAVWPGMKNRSRARCRCGLLMTDALYAPVTTLTRPDKRRAGESRRLKARAVSWDRNGDPAMAQTIAPDRSDEDKQRGNAVWIANG